MWFETVSHVGGLTYNVITYHVSQFLENNLALFKYCQVHPV